MNYVAQQCGESYQLCQLRLTAREIYYVFEPGFEYIKLIRGGRSTVQRVEAAETEFSTAGVRKRYLVKTEMKDYQKFDAARPKISRLGARSVAPQESAMQQIQKFEVVKNSSYLQKLQEVKNLRAALSPVNNSQQLTFDDVVNQQYLL